MIPFNTIYQGDNLAIMQEMPDVFVDLCYIDPPFFTQKDYKNIWGDKESVLDYENVQSLNGFKDTKDFFERHIHSGAKGLNAYLEWMRIRLVEIHRILKPTGSFYCHLDYHAVHYVKVILDEIFGYDYFKSEIIWRRSNPKGLVSKTFANNYDAILYYTKSDNYKWNSIFEPLTEKYIKQFYTHVDSKTGRRYQLGPLNNPSSNRPNLTYEWKGHKRVWRWTMERMKKADKEGLISYSSTGLARQKIYLDERKGRAIDNIWLDIKNLQGKTKEKTGWPTQKPVSLLERIIKASSNEGDLVFDCFAGCGTSMHAAHNLKRKWIGIDISPTAVDLIKKRFSLLDIDIKVIENDSIQNTTVA